MKRLRNRVEGDSDNDDADMVLISSIFSSAKCDEMRLIMRDSDSQSIGDAFRFICQIRDDEEGVKIAALCLDEFGVDINANPYGSGSALYCAAKHNTNDRMVRFLMGRGADVSLDHGRTQTPLMVAMMNMNLSEDVMVDMIRLNTDPDCSAILSITAYNTRGGERIRLFQRAGLQFKTTNRLPHSLFCLDPIASIRESNRIERKVTPASYAREQVADLIAKPRFYWALLREVGPCWDATPHDTFKIMGASADPELWRLVVAELSQVRHPTTCETLLHVAARSNNTYALSLMMRAHFNPLLLSVEGKRPVDLLSDPTLREALATYTAFRPTPEFGRWLGPYVCERAFTFLCVMHRLGRPRVVTLAILRALIQIEYV